MRTVYIAEDGVQFDDEWDCQEHEWTLHHQTMNEITFLDKAHNRLNWSFKDEFYSHTFTVIVTNESQIEALRDFAEYTGFICFANITGCGTWTWHEPENWHGDGTFMED